METRANAQRRRRVRLTTCYSLTMMQHSRCRQELSSLKDVPVFLGRTG